jgi:cytochrome c2
LWQINNFTFLLQLHRFLYGINKDKPMMIYKHLSIKVIAVLFIIGIAGFTSAQVSADAGKDLFKANCAACHSKDMRSAATGPALGGSQAKWGDDVALYGWVRNSQAMVAKGSSTSC